MIENNQKTIGYLIVEHILITPAQCRMARALLNWTQPELAEKCNLAPMTISKFEKEGADNRPEARTLEKIRRALESGGVEFAEDDGVKRNVHRVQIYQGVEGFAKFYDELYEVAKSQGGEFCVNNVSEKIFDKWHGTRERLQSYLDRMAEVIRNDPTFNMRIIIEEGDTNFRATKYAQYRWANKEQFSDISFYVYGDRLAILIFEKDDVYISVIPNSRVANAYRKQFDMAWKLAHDPDTQ